MNNFEYYPSETVKYYKYLGVQIMVKYYVAKYGGYFSALLKIGDNRILVCTSTKLHLLLIKCEGWIDHHKELIDKLVAEGIDDRTLSLFNEKVKDFNINSFIQDQIDKALSYQEERKERISTREEIDPSSIQAQYE